MQRDDHDCLSPANRVDHPSFKRPGDDRRYWIKTTCRTCGRWLGYRLVEVEKSKPLPKGK